MTVETFIEANCIHNLRESPLRFYQELDTAGMPPSAVTKTVVSEPSSTPVEKEEPVIPKVKAKMALSPYIM